MNGNRAQDEFDYDNLLIKLGEFGPFQKKALAWLLLPAYVAGIVRLNSSNFYLCFVSQSMFLSFRWC